MLMHAQNTPNYVQSMQPHQVPSIMIILTLAMQGRSLQHVENGL